MWKTLAVLALSLLPAAALADDDRWFHVSVDGDDRVRINLPMSVISAMAPLVKEHADIQIDDHDLDRAEVQALATALRDAKDGEYVTVDDGDDNVRVRKQGKFILVDVHERGTKKKAGEQVSIKMPIDVVHALLSDSDDGDHDEDELNVAAALEALSKHQDLGDLVTVKDAEETVRIWIDRKPTS